MVERLAIEESKYMRLGMLLDVVQTWFQKILQPIAVRYARDTERMRTLQDSNKLGGCADDLLAQRRP